MADVRQIVYADDGTGTLLDPLPMLVYQKATTNHFLNSAAPVTQDVAVVSGQDYTVWVLGAGSITLSGAGTGVATEGSKFTFTASTTTLTCTYAATLTHVQVEDGTVPTGMIITDGTAKSTDLLEPTYAAANHEDSGRQRYTMNLDYSGDDTDVLRIGSDKMLECREILDPDKVFAEFGITQTPVSNLTMTFNDGSTWGVDYGDRVENGYASGSTQTDETALVGGILKMAGGNNTALSQFYCNSNNLTGSIPDLSANTELIELHCLSNNLTDYAGGWPNKAFNFNVSNNTLTETAVNLILTEADTYGIASGTTITLNGGTNAAPTGAGITAKNNLIANGATVTTN